MAGQYEHVALIISLILSIAVCKEPELPPCPTNIQFLPQSLPMHCRMMNQPNPQQMLPQTPAVARMGPPPNQQPPGYNNPAGKMPQPLPFSMPGPMPPGMPMPMPMPMPGGDPSHKLPVIVMPFYSQDPSYSNNKQPEQKKKRKKKKSKKRNPHDVSFDTSNDASDHSDGSDEDHSNDEDFRRFVEHNKRSAHRSRVHKKSNKGLLTPILQYVTRDGYVIYEKELSKNEANEWEDAGAGQKKNTIRIRAEGPPLLPARLPPPPPPPPPTTSPPAPPAPALNDFPEPDSDSKDGETVTESKYILPKQYNQMTKIKKNPIKIRKRIHKRRNRFRKEQQESPLKELDEELREAQQGHND